MRRAVRLGLVSALAVGSLLAVQAQPAPASLRPDFLKSTPFPFVVDTARKVTVVTAESSDAVTRPLVLRIGGGYCSAYPHHAVVV